MTDGAIGNDLTKNNSSGFSALPSGFRISDGTFYDQSGFGYWWSASEFVVSSACYRYLGYDCDFLYRNYLSESCGISVRLVKD
jgi:uncharacterized protein (TIGR02145 family)